MNSSASIDELAVQQDGLYDRFYLVWISHESLSLCNIR